MQKNILGGLLLSGIGLLSLSLTTNTACSSASANCDALCACPEKPCASGKPSSDMDCKKTLDNLKSLGGCGMNTTDGSMMMMNDSGQMNDAADDGMMMMMCTLQKGVACGSGISGCCAMGTDCGYGFGTGGSKVCCASDSDPCSSPSDCCQTKNSDNYRDCQNNKCCIKTSQTSVCTNNSDCCSGNCDMGTCAP